MGKGPDSEKGGQALRKPIVIVGAGGFGREVAQLITDINEEKPTWEILGFVDDDPGKREQDIGGLAVIRTIGDMAWPKTRPAIALGIGFPRVKRRIIRQITERFPEAEFPALIHPSASVGRNVAFGPGCLIAAGCVLTVDINMGSFVLLNLLCTVGHDATIGNFTTCYVNVNLAGYSALEDGVEMGTGSVVIPGKTVGSGSVVGAGAVVVNDIPPNSVAVGVPARVIKEVEDKW
mgnify:CR=1 FL=1